MTTADYWKQVREACDKATPGPWEATVDDHGDDWLELSYTIVLGSDHDNWKDDAAFIALSRTALPLALARIEELEAALDTKAKVAAAWEGLAVERSRVMCAAEDKITAVGELLSANGCDCDCDHHHDEHSDGCFRCLACRVSAALVEP